MSDVHVPAAPFDLRSGRPERFRGARQFFWSVRRELWENRSIYLAPATVGAIVLIGFFVALGTLLARIRAAVSLGPEQIRAAIEQPYVIAALILMTADLVIAVFYCLDALYGERRDRSVLFWKSLPVSDTIAVLAKASIPIVVLPLVTFIVTVATQELMLLTSTIVLGGAGIHVEAGSDSISLVEFSRLNFSHLVLFHGVWYAPIYAWLLLVSAWAKRVPFLWAVLPPVAIGIVERIAFNSTRLMTLVETQFLGGGPITSASHVSMTMDMFGDDSAVTPANPALWVAMAVTALFLFGAVRLRRSRGAM